MSHLGVFSRLSLLLILCLFGAGLAEAQTIANKNQLPPTIVYTDQANTFGAFLLDASNTSVFRPKFGLTASIPATCTTGDVYEATDATAGQNWYFCTATNTWTQQLNSGAGGADKALDNLASVNINTSLLAQTGVDLGSTTKPFRNAFLFGAGTYGTTYFELTGTPTSTRVWTIQDATDTFLGRATTDTLTHKTFDTAGAGNSFSINGNAISTVSGTGSQVALTTNPTFVGPTLGVALATSINGLTITSSTGTFSLTNAKTFSVTNTMTLSGTDSSTYTFPGASATIAGLATNQAFSGNDTFTGNVDASGATITKLRVGAGLTTSANGDIGYDTTNKNWHANQNTADSYIFTGLVSGSYVNGDCPKIVVASSQITLADTGSACSTLTNPMTTLGDMIYENATPVAARLIGPTTDGSTPYILTSVPNSSNISQAPAWVPGGVPVDTESSASVTVQGAGTATDRASLLNTTNNTTSTATSIAAAGSSGFDSNYVYATCNSGSVINTITPTTSTVNGNATQKLLGLTAGGSPECAFWWSSNTNYFSAVILPTDANGRLAASGFPALTGDCTTSAGALATTCTKINGTAFPTSAAVIGSNGSAQPISATGHAIESIFSCSDSSGSGTVQVCNTSPSYTPAAGDTIIYNTTTTNTGDVTINVDSLGAKHARKWQGSATLASGDLVAGVYMLATYDGTFWEFYTIGNAPSGGGGSSALSAITAATGANTIANGNNGLQIWNWAATTNQNQFQFGETTAATSGTLGNQYILSAKTLAGSTAVPFGVISSLTGSQTLPTVYITPTWNTSGVVDAALLINVTNTGSGAASKLFDAQIGGTSQFSLDKAGNTIQLGTASLGTSPPTCASGTAGSFCLGEGTPATGASSVDDLDANSTFHAVAVNNNNTGDMAVSRTACVNITPVTVAANVTSDQLLQACSLTANTLNVIGHTLKVYVAGVFSTAAASTASLTFKVKLCTVSGCGSGTVISPITTATGATTALTASNLTFSQTSYVTTQTAGASSAYEAHGFLTIDLSATAATPDSVYQDTNTATVGTIDSTGAVFVQITVAASAGSTSNSFTERQLVVELIN